MISDNDIYISYGTPHLEFETSNECLAEKAVLLLVQQRCKNGSTFVSLESNTADKVEVGTKKDQQENSTACTARESDVQSLKEVKNDYKMIHIRFPCRTEVRAYKWMMRNLGVIEVRLTQLFVNEFRAN